MTEPENLRREREMLRQQIEAEEGESSGASDLLGQARLRERTAAAPDLDMVMDIPVRVTLEVGGSDMAIRDLL